VSRRVTERRHVEARLIERPSQVEFAERQIQECQRELGGSVTRLVSQRATEARGRFAMPSENLEDNAYVGMVFGSRATQNRRAY
jgi:hypothetical protein